MPSRVDSWTEAKMKKHKLAWPAKEPTKEAVSHEVIVWLFQEIWPELRDDSYKEDSYKGD